MHKLFCTHSPLETKVRSVNSLLTVYVVVQKNNLPCRKKTLKNAMEGKRTKYFRNVIKKCAATEVKCKKKQAIDQWKKKEIPNKKNTKASSHNFEDSTQAITQIVTVPIADIHHEPGNKKIECDKDETESCEIEIQELEVTIELEEMGDENVNSTERGGNSSDKSIISDSDDTTCRLTSNERKAIISQQLCYEYQQKEDGITMCTEVRGHSLNTIQSNHNVAIGMENEKRASYQEHSDDQKGDYNRNTINSEKPESIKDDLESPVNACADEVLPNINSMKSKQNVIQIAAPSCEQSDELQPTFTDIIPEEAMEIIRKSLEEGENNDITLPEIDSENKSLEKLNKRKRKRKTIKKNYIDFLSEEEDFVWDSTSWKDTDDESTSSGQEPKKKRKKSKKSKGPVDGKVGDEGLKKKKINRRLKEKEARQKGKGYVKKDGTIISEKKLRPNPCTGKKCGHNCEDVTEEKRKNLFDYFWGLTPSKRKDWLVALSNKREAKRKRVKDSGYRENTFEYFINDGEGRRQVCLKFILKTLDLSHKYVYYTVSNASYGLSKEDQRGKTIPANKTTGATRESVIKFIKNLPALPSHYCRKDTTRLYLPVEFKSIKNLYRIYKEDRTSQSLNVVSENVFRDIFKSEFNLGFHVPKKDKCVKCMRFETDLRKYEVEKKDHLEEKDASKKRYYCHRELGKENPSILCTSFDLQKVLNTPYGNSILLFYTRKYAVYNLCFYENVTREGYCFLWGEADAKRGGNEIATILEKYIQIVDSRGTIKHLILYSDSCPGQNKNKIVMAAVHHALSNAKNLESIQLNFLLPGHTEMSVDSMHSVIENSVRNTTVWAPSQWLTVCQVARKEVSPYNVQWLDHTEFKNFEEVSQKYFKGNLIGKISKIRIATFKKSSLDNISVKYSMKDETEEELIPVIGKSRTVNSKLYKALLPISKAKYNDLKKLCDTGVIPKIFHKEYLTLPTVNVKDVLLDTDIEDSEEEY